MEFELTTLVVIGTDCTGSCKSHYVAITTMKVPIVARPIDKLIILFSFNYEKKVIFSIHVYVYSCGTVAL